MRPLSLHSFACFFACIAIAACSKSEKREWNASDHDRSEEAAKPQPPAPGPAPTAAAADPWASSCAPCHGTTGKGDGPMGAALRVPDLTNKDWQAKVSDQQIAEVIKSGRGRMPGFGSLPATSVDALVKHVRSFR
jgi:mono/diheme cytochrome c family protein